MSKPEIKPNLPPHGSQIHLIGIGGTGLSNIAFFLMSSGFKVTGSDYLDSPIIQSLRERGAKIFIGHQSANILRNIKLVIKSAAISEDNPEIVRAKKYGIPIIKYAEALGLLLNQKIGIAVSGTHGKTTTSSLISYLLHRSELDPSFIVGGVLSDFNTGAHCGKGKYFVAEACEYDRSFHHLSGKIKIVNNIEPDHMDYYKTIDNLVESFHKFIAAMPSDGYVVANIENKNVLKCLRMGTNASVVTFSSKENKNSQWYPKNIRVVNDCWYFDAYKNSKKYGSFEMGIPGDHNVTNGLVAVIVSSLLGLGRNITKKSLAEFGGVKRRFEVIARINGRLIIDDYAHHPTEVDTVLKTARKLFPGRRLWIVFQPHLYSRTKLFLKQFVRILSEADIVIMPPIYAARDTSPEQRTISSQDVVDKVNRAGGNARYFADFNDIANYLKLNTIKADIIITVGAGDGWQIGTRFIELLKQCP